ncbi:MAG: hypothetical protein AAFU65_01590 [Pseudomonadota bacterium]
MNATPSPSGNRDARIRTSTRQLAAWTGAWLVTLAVATFGPVLLWSGATLPTLVAVAANVLVGIGMIRANKRHLECLDEMQQRLQLEAMGVTLGLSLVAGLAWSTLDIADVLHFHAEIAHLCFFVGLTYLASIALLRRKYL